jgi:hypothetical protein
MIGVIENILHSTAKMCRSTITPSFMYHVQALTADSTSFSSFVRLCKRKSRQWLLVCQCGKMWVYQTITTNPCRHINAELLLMSTQYSFSYNSQIKCFWTHVNIDIFSCFGIWNSCPKFIRTFQLQPVYSIVFSRLCAFRISSGYLIPAHFVILTHYVTFNCRETNSHFKERGFEGYIHI